MKHQVFKKLKLIAIFLTLIYTLSGNVAYAAGCSSIANPDPNDPTAQLKSIICPVYQVFNIAVFSSGAIFVGLILLGSLKFSLSQGDQKAIEGAKATITWGVIGFLIVLGATLILNLILGTFGISNPLNALESSIDQILCWAKGTC